MFAFYTSPSAAELDMVTSGGPFCASKSELSKWEVLVCFFKGDIYINAIMAAPSTCHQVGIRQTLLEVESELGKIN